MDAATRTWRRVLLAAKVRYRAPEQLRHTFASTMLSRNVPLLYVQQQGGWRSASVLLRVYARWMPQEPTSAPSVTPVSPAGQTAGLLRRKPTTYFSMQKPWASMPRATLNLLRKFSRATAAVSSTISASEKWPRARPNSSPDIFSPVIVITSA
ncbi:MAG: hypothetical protein DMD91_11245 [Candidatus Rokuibacteriota bacterium]|nr:MAG: hypothetical protein DMD91_11245 [Candidatus Rokubacteria bacterium]